MNISVKLSKMELESPVIASCLNFKMACKAMNTRAGAIMLPSVMGSARSGKGGPRFRSLSSVLLCKEGMEYMSISEYVRAVGKVRNGGKPVIAGVISSSLSELYHYVEELRGAGADVIEIRYSQDLDYMTLRYSFEVIGELNELFGDVAFALRLPLGLEVHNLPEEVKSAENLYLIVGEYPKGIDVDVVNLQVRPDALPPPSVLGGYALPLCLYSILSLRSMAKLPILAMGGIMDHIDVLKCIVVGAKASCLFEAILSRGLKAIDEIVSGLEGFLKDKVIHDINAIFGRARMAGSKPSRVVPSVDGLKCGGCLRCVKCCPRDAVYLRYEVPEVNEDLCDGCGLCICMCPRGALKLASLVEVE